MTFERAHEFTTRWEGGWSNHPADTGGATMYGVTQAVYNAWRVAKKLAPAPVRRISRAVAEQIYRERYWSHVQHLSWPLSGVAYDICVNHGAKNLNYMLGQVNAAGPTAQARQLTHIRERFYRNIVKNRPSQRVFLKGWLNRCNAQKRWLRQQQPDTVPRVFMRDTRGKNAVWDGRTCTYGGVVISMYADGAIQLERKK